MEGTDEWQKTQELADYFKVPLSTIYTWNHEGTGPPFIKIGRHVRYRKSDVEAWVAEHSRGAA